VGHPKPSTCTPSWRNASTNWNVAQTVSVRAQDDGLAEGERVYAVSHSSQSESEGFNHVAIKNVRVTVVDNDKPQVIVRGTGDSDLVLEGDAVSQITDTYTVALGKPVLGTDTVTVTVTHDEQVTLATADSRYDAATGTILYSAAHWNVPLTFTVTAVADGIAENTLISSIQHAGVASNPAYGVISSASFAKMRFPASRRFGGSSGTCALLRISVPARV
jgi:hypothetical protein